MRHAETKFTTRALVRRYEAAARDGEVLEREFATLLGHAGAPGRGGGPASTHAQRVSVAAFLSAVGRTVSRLPGRVAAARIDPADATLTLADLSLAVKLARSALARFAERHRDYDEDEGDAIWLTIDDLPRADARDFYAAEGLPSPHRQ